MSDQKYNFKLAGIHANKQGTDKHSDLIRNHINILEAVVSTIRDVSIYGTERQINDEVNRRIRACQNVLGMWGDRRSAILYFEANIPFPEVKDKNKYTVEHVIPVSIAVSEYVDGGSIENLILNPVALITRDSDDLLRKAGLVKSTYDLNFPFRRYKKVDIKIKDLHGKEIDCANYSMDDHFDLIKRVPELQQVVNEIHS